MLHTCPADTVVDVMCILGLFFSTTVYWLKYNKPPGGNNPHRYQVLLIIHFTTWYFQIYTTYNTAYQSYWTYISAASQTNNPYVTPLYKYISANSVQWYIFWQQSTKIYTFSRIKNHFYVNSFDRCIKDPIERRNVICYVLFQISST